jgi:hypothetical protein
MVGRPHPGGVVTAGLLIPLAVNTVGGYATHPCGGSPGGELCVPGTRSVSISPNIPVRRPNPSWRGVQHPHRVSKTHTTETPWGCPSVCRWRSCLIYSPSTSMSSRSKDFRTRVEYRYDLHNCLMIVESKLPPFLRSGSDDLDHRQSNLSEWSLSLLTRRFHLDFVTLVLWKETKDHDATAIQGPA